MRFLPYNDCRATPNIIVDGAANEATVLTLSHWPKSGTPAALRADVSAEIAFNYLDHPELRVDAEAVSNNHFDEDGLISCYALLNPEIAMAQRELLIDIARAGDFATSESRSAARIRFVLGAFQNPTTSPLDNRIFKLAYAEMAAQLYAELLGDLPEIMANTERYAPYYSREEAWLDASDAALDKHDFSLSELPAFDLAILQMPASSAISGGLRDSGAGYGECHAMAVHNRINHFRVLWMQGNRYELQFRYESWVQYHSRRPMPRVNLAPLAELLNKLEGKQIWKGEGVNTLTPRLHLIDASTSTLRSDAFVNHVSDFLGRTPPEWDPYDGE